MELLFPAVFLIAILELIVSGTWQKFYFTSGIPIFKQSIRLSSPAELSVDSLNEQFQGGWCDPLRFREISRHNIAFREALFHFSFFKMNYTPVMHGLIRYDERSKELHVIGFANWFAPLFIIVFIATAASFRGADAGIDIMFTLFPIGLFALLYFIQFRRFTGVRKAFSLQNSWQRKD